MGKNKQRCEKVTWDYIKRETKIYNDDDNNDGFIFGLHIYEHKNDYVDIIDVEWFKTEKERDDYVRENKLYVIVELK